VQSNKEAAMLRGFTTISYWTDDMAAAKAWYTELLGIEPYMDRGPYVEFRLGDYSHELGLIDTAYLPEGVSKGPGGVVMYWAVDDVDATLDRLLDMGATLHEKPADRGEGYITATVIDPFGNILGIMYNPHYLEVLASLKGSAEG
jgi:predicted enzyme related to lactoylglutathione lyase